MFGLTHAQFEQFEVALEASVRQRVLSAAATRWNQPLSALAPQFNEALTAAQSLGFTTDAELGAYLDLVRRHGDDFVQQPWAAPFFTKVPVDHPAGTLMYLQAFSAQGG